MSQLDLQETLFTGGNFCHKPNLKHGERVVVSASRRTDLIKWYPAEMLDTLAGRYTPDKVHTLVIWTKFAEAPLEGRMHKALANYDNLYIHLTCTGLGGTAFEPLVPGIEETFRHLPQLIDLVNGPEHIKLRIDPIIRVRSKQDATFTNVPLIKEILRAGVSLGIRRYATSFLCLYPKVKKQFLKAGEEVAPFTEYEQRQLAGDLLEYAESLGAQLDACAVPGLPASRCIDGELLAKLHPDKLPCSVFEPRTRELCGCTHSIDIGGFYNRPCFSGCLYCYANMRTPDYGAQIRR